MAEEVYMAQPLLARDETIIEFCRNGKGVHIASIDCGSKLVRISKNVVVKYGLDVTAEEAANQEYVYRNTRNALRVPQVHRFFQDASKGAILTIGYLVMEYMEGIQLDTFDLTKRPDLTEKVFSAIECLWQIPTPQDRRPGPIGNGKPRGYLWSDFGLGMSFESVADMEQWLNGRLALLKYHSPATVDLGSFKLVMCHTDLATRNILLLADGTICFLDWAFAGFYPWIFEAYSLKSRLQREPRHFGALLDRFRLTQVMEQQLDVLGLVERVNSTCCPFVAFQEEVFISDSADQRCYRNPLATTLTFLDLVEDKGNTDGFEIVCRSRS